LRDSEAPRREAHQRSRHHRHIVVQVFLEVRVVALDDRNLQGTREADAVVVGDERRLDVYDIEAALRELRAQRAQRAQLHHAVLGIARQIARGDADRLADLGGAPGGIVRRNQHRLVAGRMQPAPEGLDRRRNAVDPRKIHVRDHQDAHAGSRACANARQPRTLR
jgi:hypothetical protein